MSALSAKLRSVAFDAAGTKTGISYWCPGCGRAHSVCTSGGSPSWTWDGNEDAPTISPSVNVTRANMAATVRDPAVCHHFVRAGMIEFLGDCTHALKGQTVPLPDWPRADRS